MMKAAIQMSAISDGVYRSDANLDVNVMLRYRSIVMRRTMKIESSEEKVAKTPQRLHCHEFIHFKAWLLYWSRKEMS